MVRVHSTPLISNRTLAMQSFRSSTICSFADSQVIDVLNSACVTQQFKEALLRLENKKADTP